MNFHKRGSAINSSWFELSASKGFESDELKTFMRAMVILADLLVFIPPALLVFKDYDFGIAPLIVLCHPSLLIIDHGHFQYLLSN